MYRVMLVTLLLVVSTQAQAFVSECNSTSSSIQTFNVGQFPPLPSDTGSAEALFPKISNKRTVSPFLAWNGPKYFGKNDDKYLLHWTKNPLANDRAIVLTEIYWNYVYPNKAHAIWTNKKLQDAHTTSINWDHAAEYGETLALDVTKETFPDAFAEEVLSQYRASSHLDGIMLDWWHKKHPVPWRGRQLEKAMERIALALRAKLGEEFILLGNVNWKKYPKLTRHLNGVFLELWKSNNGAYSCNEIAKMEKLIKFHDKILLPPKIIAFEPWRVTNRKLVSPPEISADRNSPENQRYARLFSAMSTVIASNGYILYADNNTDFGDGDHHHFYYDVFRVDLGKPTSGPLTIKAGISVKQFERGYVAFNRRKSDVKLQFANFIVTVPAMDAVFVTNAGESAIQQIPISLPKYGRTLVNLRKKFDCLRQALSEEALKTYPTEKEIADLIVGLENNSFYRTKRHLIKLGLDEETVEKHKVNLLRLVNFEGTNEAYCEKPIR